MTTAASPDDLTSAELRAIKTKALAKGDDYARSLLREQRIACNVGDQHDFFEAFAAPRRSLRRVLHWAVRSTRRRGEERLLQRSSSKSVPTMPQKELASSSRCDLSGNRKRSLFRQAVGGETPTFTTSERKTGLEPATPTLARLCSTN